MLAGELAICGCDRQYAFIGAGTVAKMHVDSRLFYSGR